MTKPQINSQFALEEGVQDIPQRQEKNHHEAAPIQGRVTLYGISPTQLGLIPRASAVPGQLERPDLYGKPQHLPEYINEDVIGPIVPATFSITLEAAAKTTRWNSELDHKTISLDGIIEDIGFDGSNIITVRNDKRHDNPYVSAQYQEDLIPRMEKAAENLPRN